MKTDRNQGIRNRRGGRDGNFTRGGKGKPACCGGTYLEARNSRRTGAKRTIASVRQNKCPPLNIDLIVGGTMGGGYKTRAVPVKFSLGQQEKL